MTSAEKLSMLREQMNLHNIHALMVPTADPHQTEYLPDHWKHRQWLTGFTGSAGTALVTGDAAFLWTDFRYWIQAEEQLKGTEFTLFPAGKPGVPTPEEWLCSNLAPGQRVGVDGKVFSVTATRKMKGALAPRRLELVTNLDIVSSIWKDRPAMPDSLAFDFPAVFSGEMRKDRLKRIRERISASWADWLLVTTLDDLAWSFSMRGRDIPCTPVNLGFALIGMEDAFLFMDEKKIPANLAQCLAHDGITLKGYEEIYAVAGSIQDGQVICLDPATTSDALFGTISPEAVILEGPGIIESMKAIKNSVEIVHSRDTAIKDGAAVVNFMYWLEHQFSPVTEQDAAAKLYECRTEQKDFVEPSFTSITASGAHGAMCHYQATPETDIPIAKDALFLFDSGGNYRTGTTDITRTIHPGNPSRQEIVDYTMVLKSHINVATAKFPRGTRGYQIDTLARQVFWENGLDFGHGTGHGVGFFLGVHEGPARISSWPADVALAPGMILTNEPGLYREEKYGIRLENMILVQESVETEFGQFLEFETLTLCPFEKNLIDLKMLDPMEIQWVNAYHDRVYEKLAPVLPESTKKWLQEKTAPV